jgi:hypothetical protein
MHRDGVTLHPGQTVEQTIVQLCAERLLLG